MVSVPEASSAGTEFAGSVDMRVPADAVMSRVLRLASSGVASLAGYNVAEIDDIKIAVSEVLIALIEIGDDHPVEIGFVVDGDSFSIEGISEVAGTVDVDNPDLRLCRLVLAAVCTEHRIEQVGPRARIAAVLRRPFPAG